MKKLTALAVALTMLLSFAACNSDEVGGSADAGDTTTAKAETVKDETTAAKSEETTVPEETTTEETTTTETAAELSEMDALVKDIIAERAATFDKDPHYQYDDGKTLMWVRETRKPGTKHDTLIRSIIYDTEKKEFKDFVSGTAYYFNKNIYTEGMPTLIYDMDGNVISELERDTGWCNLFGDGRMLCWEYTSDKWHIFDKDLKNPVEIIPDMTVDIGHGMTEEINIEYFTFICGSKVYFSCEGETSGAVKKVMDVNTLEFSDISEDEERFFDYASYNIYNFAGKYKFYGNKVINIETGEECRELDKYGSIFVTPEAFYYVENHKLYKYISENNGELIYDGSQNQSGFSLVGENYLVVKDDLGTFLYNRATGEETKLDLE